MGDFFWHFEFKRPRVVEISTEELETGNVSVTMVGNEKIIQTMEKDYVKLTGKMICGASALMMMLVFCSTSSAHMAFKKHLQKKYPGMKVNCNACHIKKKPKTERSEFGKLFAKPLKESNPTITADWKSKKGDEKKKYEAEVMVPAFDKLLTKVKMSKNDKDEVYDELIKAGKIDGITNDPKYNPEGSGAEGPGKR